LRYDIEYKFVIDHRKLTIAIKIRFIGSMLTVTIENSFIFINPIPNDKKDLIRSKLRIAEKKLTIKIEIER
ncbi:MAG: hypothetical protein K0T99_00675, partial [Alphaproteobacteria bacterium]|nr:hypothetical protein [Alphaproteobacteria bacterium]